MLIHRCPWCGEEISPLIFFNRHSDKLSVCPNCKNAIALYARKNGKEKNPQGYKNPYSCGNTDIADTVLSAVFSSSMGTSVVVGGNSIFCRNYCISVAFENTIR